MLGSLLIDDFALLLKYDGERILRIDKRLAKLIGKSIMASF